MDSFLMEVYFLSNINTIFNAFHAVVALLFFYIFGFNFILLVYCFH